MSGGIWHPDGCRCSGCIPARQVVIRQEHPSSGPPSTPQQRPRKPSPRKQSAGDWGIAIPAFLIIGLGWLVLCWPAIFAHGYTETGGWRWDIHSTSACAAWWGAIGLFSVLYVAGHRPRRVHAKPDLSQLPPPATPAPPACRHPHAMKVKDVYGERVVAYLCPDLPAGCGEQLDEEFGRYKRFCCGTEPGNPHWYSCPEAKVTP